MAAAGTLKANLPLSVVCGRKTFLPAVTAARFVLGGG